MTQQQAVFYREADAGLDPLAGETVAVVGYGNLGRSMALNLRDSGLSVVVGNVDDQWRRRAAQDGFVVADPADAVTDADVVYLLLPDEVIPDVYRDQVAPQLRGGTAVAFASGYVLAYDLVKPAEDLDVLLLAPRMLGEEVRQCYLEGTGFLSYVNVEQDATGRATERLLALARACGSLRKGAIGLTAEQEATLDLFIEQSVGPVLGMAFQLAFELAVEAGLPPEAAVCELYMSGEMSRTISTMASAGFFESVRAHGLVAAYGGLLGTEDVDRDAMDRHFRGVLEKIRSGAFARRLQEEEAQGYPVLALLDQILDGSDPLTAAERRVRAELGPVEGRVPAGDQPPAEDGVPTGDGRRAAAPPSATSAPRPAGETTAAPGAGSTIRR